MKKLLLLTFALSAVLLSSTAFTSYEFNQSSYDDKLREQAFAILTLKCNICHREKNRRMVFTLENMDGRAQKINRQVFKWKRMPKGKDIKLTKEESTQLKTWINAAIQN